MNVDDQIRDGAGQVSFETALGTCGVCWSALGITEVLLPPARGLAPGRDQGDVPEAIGEAIAGIAALLGGERRDLRSVVLDERALDEFQRRVYAATRVIGPGETASYGQIAGALGAPQEARAVGAALGRNPFPVVVPCHRVLSANGALHGFSAPGGLRTKRRMLEIEGAPGFTQQALFA
ncbi:MAG TPA: methylated-DNA--[protein]-cysteine S-methyltransferase [Solirubrobacteraceae bacterium]|nr:methylated-DNA--[protein]-cysteine S-methyltransferase [Solirubrobacteraceae bacterium]